MDIAVPGTYSYGFLDLQCPSKTIYPSSNGCDYLSTTCTSGSKSDVVFSYSTETHEYECSNSGTEYCCPTYYGEIKSCDANTNCTVDCSSSSCSEYLIDGSDSNYLAVDCGSYQCQSAIIHCPSGGCHVKCDGAYACSSAQISYIGELDDDGTIKVTCIDGYACYAMSYDGDYAQNVELVVSGGYAMYSAYLYAENAGTVTVWCSSDDGSYACYSSNWYIPEDSTTFNCYGEGMSAV